MRLWLCLLYWNVGKINNLRLGESIYLGCETLHRKPIPGLFTDALTVDNSDVRVELFEDASLEDLRASDDPVVQFVLKLRPLTKAMEDKQDIYEGQMAVLAPKYVQARKAFYGRPLAPDANGTLRVTYGTVRGYRPSLHL